MSKSKISWCTWTWSPVTGCTKLSAGCRECWAKTLWDMRHKAYMEGKQVPKQYAVPFETVTLHHDRLRLPNWQAPQKVFVNSMSDLFHEDVPDEFILQIINSMRAKMFAGDIFQVLTKRPERMRNFLPRVRWNNDVPGNLRLADIEEDRSGYPLCGCRWHQKPMPHIWWGTTCENQPMADLRVPKILQTPASVRWISAEPLLGPIDFRKDIGGTLWIGGQRGHDGRHHGIGTPECPRHLHHHHDIRCNPGLDWIVVGCESGKNRRPCKIEWIEDIVAQCKQSCVPVFVKQMEVNGKVTSDINKFPAHLRIREFPNTQLTIKER